MINLSIFYFSFFFPFQNYGKVMAENTAFLTDAYWLKTSEAENESNWLTYTVWVKIHPDNYFRATLLPCY